MEKAVNFEKTCLGIEFGSTRIKACLIDESFEPIASGAHDWENKLENGYWTYSLEDIMEGMRDCYRSLTVDVREKFGVSLKKVGAIGISGMMHGYLAFDENDRLLTPFRTWRNTTTGESVAALSEYFTVPQRWTVSHLYQAILNGEEHVSQIAHVTTLAGYIHYLLTGRREVGVGEASGIFPVDSLTCDYDKKLVSVFDSLTAQKNFSKSVTDIFPAVRSAGFTGAYLTKEGAALLDESGELEAGIPLCPPEGDAGTGMVATNSVRPRTGNVSAGTSIFSMLVLDRPMKSSYPEIDMVTTPDGAPVAMVHCNNCCGEIDAWAKIFGEFAALTGHPMKKSEVYDALYYNALNGDPDCGGIISYNYLSAEPVMKVERGCPMYLRGADSVMNLANFFRAQIVSAIAALRVGMDILFELEGMSADRFTGHGGLFKTPKVAQQILADALDAPVSAMKSAGEGGAWGMSILASFMINKNGRTLPDFLDEAVFNGMESITLEPTPEGKAGVNSYINLYKTAITAQTSLL